MKAPAFSAPPLSGEPEKKKLSFRELLLGQRKNERCFEAEDAARTRCLLWMESSSFGSRYAYPCLIREEGAEPLSFDSSSSAEANRNNSRLMARWAELTTPERMADMEIRPLELKDFRTRLRALRDGEERQAELPE